MVNARIRFGRRRRASAGVVLLLLVPLIGYDYVRSELQKREAWHGTVVRIHSARRFIGKRSYNYFWDVRTGDGTVRSPLIRPQSVWSNARVGDQVIKEPGELNPRIVNRR